MTFQELCVLSYECGEGCVISGRQGQQMEGPLYPRQHPGCRRGFLDHKMRVSPTHAK